MQFIGCKMMMTKKNIQFTEFCSLKIKYLSFNPKLSNAKEEKRELTKMSDEELKLTESKQIN